MTEIELAYAAGIVDGEGSIGIYRHSGARVKPRKHHVMRVHMSVSQCDIRLPIWFQDRFGGYVHRLGIPKLGRREAFSWDVDGTKQCVPILESLLPYLMLKKEQAELALLFCRQQRNIRHLPENEKEAEYAKREIWVARARALNHRGTAPAETKRSGAHNESCDSPICTEDNVQRQAEMSVPVAVDGVTRQ